MTTLEWTSRRVLEELFTPETRRQAAEAFWEFDRFPTQVHKQVEELLIQVVKWRPQRFRSLPVHKKAERLLVHLHHPALDAVRWLMVAAYMELRVPDLGRDLNEFWGVEYTPWKGGQPVQVPPPPTPAQVAEGLLHFKDRYLPQQIAAYLAYIGMQDLQWREVFWPCIAGVLASEPSPGATAPHSAPLHATSEDALFREIPELTALDLFLVQSAIEAASAGDQPALERVARAMDDLLRLVPGRQVAWFHQGVLRQLQASCPPAPVDGAARDWYLAGRICLLMELQAVQPLIALVDEEAKGVASLLDNGNGGAPICALILVTTCWLEGRLEEAIGFLRPALLARLGSGMVHLLVTMAEDRLTAHGPREARLMIDRVREVIDHLPTATFPRHFTDHLAHLRACCLRGEGCFAESRALLDGLLCCRSKGMVQADLGLAAGEFRWLSEAWVPDTREQVPALIERLRRGQEQYRTAIRISRDPALPEALYPLGLLALLEGEAEVAVGHLEAACAEAVKHEARYLAGRLLARIQAVSGMALLLTLNEAHLGRAMERLRLADGMYPAAQWPSWLLSEAAQIVDLSDGPEAAALLEWLQQRTPALAEVHLRDPHQLLRSASLYQALASRAAQLRDRDPLEAWQDNAALLAACLQGSRPTEAGTALDRLEWLALQHPELRERWLDLLGRPAAYSPTWDEEDALQAAAHLCEASCQLERAYRYLRLLVFRARDQGRADRVACLLERIRAYHLPEDLVDEVATLAGASAAPVAQEEDHRQAKAESALRKGLPLRLLVVGGDESEARFAGEILTHFTERAPGLQIDFEFTPRTSSWDRYYERLKGRLERYDGMVMLPWMRTHLGRLLRALAGERQVPWFPCPGSGRFLLQRSIMEAACSLARARSS